VSRAIERQPVDRIVIGWPAEVDNALRTARDAGLIAAVGRPLYRADGQVKLKVRFLEPVPSQTSRRALRVAGYTAATVTGLAVLAAAVWGLIVALTWLAGHWVQVAFCGALALLALGSIVKAIGGGGHGHCPGAWHR
jgi:hypothetical protein